MAKKRKTYSPTAPYVDLKQVERLINEAQTIDDLRQIVRKDGPKIGYKAFCYILSQKMTPEAMKADEATMAAFTLEKQGHTEEAMAIFKKVVEAHPDHPLARSKISE
ncbi:MAG: tetratricopeptide repeat protein [Ardenticatenaceae bacterium]